MFCVLARRTPLMAEEKGYYCLHHFQISQKTRKPKHCVPEIVSFAHCIYYRRRHYIDEMGHIENLANAMINNQKKKILKENGIVRSV